MGIFSKKLKLLFKSRIEAMLSFMALKHTQRVTRWEGVERKLPILAAERHHPSVPPLVRERGT